MLSDLDRPEVFVASAANEERTDCMIICDEVEAVSIAAMEAGVIFDDWPLLSVETDPGATVVGFGA